MKRPVGAQPMKVFAKLQDVSSHAHEKGHLVFVLSRVVSEIPACAGMTLFFHCHARESWHLLFSQVVLFCFLVSPDTKMVI